MYAARRQGRASEQSGALAILELSNPRALEGVYFRLGHSHIVSMAEWQKSYTREPAKTKAELREMLTEAVRNTQPSSDDGPKRLPKAKAIAARH
jgi:hypothetical protein